MTERSPYFQLSKKTAEKIIELLGDPCDTETKRATPTQICQELDINRRTFNSAVSKAIFTTRPTEAQTLLREHIMEMIYTEVYVD